MPAVPELPTKSMLCMAVIPLNWRLIFPKLDKVPWTHLPWTLVKPVETLVVNEPHRPRALRSVSLLRLTPKVTGLPTLILLLLMHVTVLLLPMVVNGQRRVCRLRPLNLCPTTGLLP